MTQLPRIYGAMPKVELVEYVCKLKAVNAELLAALTGLLEIAELAMPDTFFQSDTRVQAALAAIAKAKGVLEQEDGDAGKR